MVKKKLKFLFILLSTLLCLNCATYVDDIKEVRSLYKQKHYPAALEKIETIDLRTSKKNRLLYYLEKAILLDRNAELKQSRKLLLRAEQVANELYTKSITKEIGTYLVNESTQEYPGENYEIIAIHTMLALSFLEDKDLAAAGVEARKINNKLYEIAQKLGKKNNSYKEDAFARYLSGIIFEARGEIDDALIDYQKAVKILNKNSYKKFYRGNSKQQIEKALFKLAQRRGRKDILENLPAKYKTKTINANKPQSAQVIVIHETGIIASKYSKDFIIPLEEQVIRFSFPVIKPDFPRAPNLDLTANNNKNGKTFNFANMNAIAHMSLEDKRLRMILKGGLRIFLKAKLTQKAHENFGLIGGIIANIAAVATESADTRSWNLLPAAFFVSRIYLPPGQHKIKIQHGSTSSQIEHTFRAGEILLLRDKGQGINYSN